MIETEGADFVTGLETDEVDLVIHKGQKRLIESYSAFEDPWGLCPSELEKTLREHGITHVFVTGLGTPPPLATRSPCPPLAVPSPTWGSRGSALCACGSEADHSGGLLRQEYECTCRGEGVQDVRCRGLYQGR